MWLYVPTASTSSAFAPGGAGLTLDLNWQSRALAASCTWRGKPSPARTWLQRCSKVSWLKLLCGAMLPPSTAAHGAALWMASLAASRASRTAWPENGSAKTTNATYGVQRGGSSSNAARGSSLSKTSAASFRAAGPNASGETFDGLALSWRQDCLRRQKSARRTSVNGGSGLQWPTPATRGFKGANGPDHLMNGTGKLHLDQLPNFVEHLWATPCARDFMPPHTPEYIAQKKAQGHGMKILPDQVALWPTPTSLSYSDSHQPGNSRSYNLTMDLALSLQVQMTSQAGETSSQPRRTLNPLFVEWLMGWPLGWTLLAWTDFACSETELFHWKRRMRFALLQLGLPPAASAVQLGLFG